jgi:hypothetical protein
MRFQCNIYLFLGRMEACRHAELDAGTEIDVGTEWGVQQMAGAVPAVSDPCAGEGRGARGTTPLR